VRLASYVLVLVLALEAAVGEAFLVAARPLGRPLPVAALAAVLGNVVLGRLGARVLSRPAAGAGPGLVWLVVALAFGSGAPGGDRVVPGSGRGLAFLVAGAAAAAGVVAVTAGGKNRTSPEAASRR
jgi:hypothetical protein